MKDQNETSKSITLLKPIMVNGEQVTAIPYDFESITAKDHLKIGRDLKSKGTVVAIEQFDGEYLLNLFAKAVSKVSTSIILNDLMRLSSKDYTKIIRLTRDFFYREQQEELQDGQSSSIALQSQE